jgi:predicted transposase/invertase (TIGR01784 family)
MAKRTRKSDEAFAIPTTDSAFKQMLAIDVGESSKKIVLSFLNSFIPEFQEDPILEVTSMPSATPPLKKAKGDQHAFMNYHVISGTGKHSIVGVQSKRHVMFDERALFYSCSTYSSQLSESVLNGPDWYSQLKPVIALQVLDYDSQRVRGIKSHVPDNLVARVKFNPMMDGQYLKHYVLTDETSGQKIKHLQLIQVELPRAKATHPYPPKDDCSERDWWLSLLCHTNRFTVDMVQNDRVPEAIQMALDRLLLSKWTPELQEEYQIELFDRDAYASILAAERAEGMVKGEDVGLATAAKRLLDNGGARQAAIEALQLSV